MKNERNPKEIVKEKYAAIAGQIGNLNTSSCCTFDPLCCAGATVSLMAEDYGALEGYEPDANLSLGCGLPTVFANMKKGDTVVDMGSGAGNDCFVARSAVGPSGRVIGIDFTVSMIDRAKQNVEKMKFDNVEFRLGDIENMPISSNTADVVVSNCVLNLVPNKHRAFSEIYRILKPGGHFSIADIVLEGRLPQKLKQAAEMYAGCVAGAIQKKEYLKIIQESGFSKISIQKEKKIMLQDEILRQYLSPSELEELRQSNPGICSIIVYAEKL